MAAIALLSVVAEKEAKEAEHALNSVKRSLPMKVFTAHKAVDGVGQARVRSARTLETQGWLPPGCPEHLHHVPPTGPRSSHPTPHTAQPTSHTPRPTSPHAASCRRRSRRAGTCPWRCCTTSSRQRARRSSATRCARSCATSAPTPWWWAGAAPRAAASRARTTTPSS
jgi:hypothetical protein